MAGNIYGRATDESGALVPGATIKLKGANIGGLRPTAGYVASSISCSSTPGNYTIAVSQLGLTTVTRDVMVTTE